LVISNPGIRAKKERGVFPNIVASSRHESTTLSTISLSFVESQKPNFASQMCELQGALLDKGGGGSF